VHGAGLWLRLGRRATLAARAALSGVANEGELEMRVPHKAFVVVADGRKMLFLRNEGDALNPNLQVERVREQDNPPGRDQGTDAPGRSFSSVGPGRSSYQETDFHQLEEDRFAAETADLLKRRALRNEFESLIVVAPPKTLGELRKHYHKEVTDRLVGEIDKDLTAHTVPQIEQVLMKAE
jgi:protein required for attachment to host cells